MEITKGMKDQIEREAILHAKNHSTAPDKETPDWIITDFTAGAEWAIKHFSLSESSPVTGEENIQGVRAKMKVLDWNQELDKYACGSQRASLYSDFLFYLMANPDRYKLVSGENVQGVPADEEWYPGKDYQELFNYLSREHGLTLLESEMQEIISIVKKHNP